MGLTISLVPAIVLVVMDMPYDYLDNDDDDDDYVANDGDDGDEDLLLVHIRFYSSSCNNGNNCQQ